MSQPEPEHLVRICKAWAHKYRSKKAARIQVMLDDDTPNLERFQATLDFAYAQRKQPAALIEWLKKAVEDERAMVDAFDDGGNANVL